MNGGASAEGKNRGSDFNNECSNDSSLKVTMVATGVEGVELCHASSRMRIAIVDVASVIVIRANRSHSSSSSRINPKPKP